MLLLHDFITAAGPVGLPGEPSDKQFSLENFARNYEQSPVVFPEN
jgi:hypothetical protein